MKTGIVLEGGGLRGAYQVGALQALEERNIEISGITGVSIGAINGALIALGKRERLEELYLSISPSDIIQGDADVLQTLDFTNLKVKDLKGLFGVVIGALKTKGLDISPLKKLLEDMIDEKALRESSIRYGIGAVDLKERKSIELLLDEIPEGELLDFILASAYLPFFKAEDRRYLDGAFYNSIPLDLLMRSDDYDRIFVIRTGAINLHQSLDREGVHVIAPSRRTGLTLEFNPKTIEKNLKLGYYDALRVLDEYPGKIYYLKYKPEDYFTNLFNNMDTESLSYLSEVYHTPGNFLRREFRESILPEIARMLRLRSKDKERIGLFLVEAVAYDLGIDPFRTLEFHEFMEELKEHLEVYDPQVKDGYIRDRNPLVAKAMMKKKETKMMVLTDTLKVIVGGR